MGRLGPVGAGRERQSRPAQGRPAWTTGGRWAGTGGRGTAGPGAASERQDPACSVTPRTAGPLCCKPRAPAGPRAASGRRGNRGVPCVGGAGSPCLRLSPRLCHTPVYAACGTGARARRDSSLNRAALSPQDDFLLIHYDKGPCRNKLGHSRASVIWHRTQVGGHSPGACACVCAHVCVCACGFQKTCRWVGDLLPRNTEPGGADPAAAAGSRSTRIPVARGASPRPTRSCSLPAHGLGNRSPWVVHPCRAPCGGPG